MPIGNLDSIMIFRLIRGFDINMSIFLNVKYNPYYLDY